MNSKHVLPLKAESFAMLVKQIRALFDKADIFEVWLDLMKVKGDLAVIQNHFQKPLIAKSNSLDMLKRAAKAGMTYIDIPHDLAEDAEFKNLLNNKKNKVIRSYHNFEETPENLLEIIKDLDSKKCDLIKIATQINLKSDNAILLSLLEIPKYKGRLIVTGMGKLSRELRIKAPLAGSVFFYAPLEARHASADGQLSKAELEKEWKIH